MIRQSKRLARKALAVALVVIFMEVLFESFIVGVYQTQAQSFAFGLLLIYMFLQIIFAPLQSGISDFSGRKKSLQVSLIISFLSSVILLLYFKSLICCVSFIFLPTILKGVAGNNLPLSLSLIADTQGKNHRISFAFSSGTYAAAFLLAIYLNETTTNYILIFLAFLLTLVCFSPSFRDVEDKKNDESDRKSNILSQSTVRESSEKISKPSLLDKIKQEPLLIRNELKQRLTRQALAAYILWEISIYSILISQVEKFRAYKVPNLATTMMLSYIIGVVALRYCRKISDSRMIKIGYYISTFSIVPYFLLKLFTLEPPLVLQVCFGLHSVGNALLSPTLMSVLAKEKSPHEQGKRYGLVESSDTIAFLIGTFVCMFFNFMNLPLFFLASFSFISFVLSWRFYGRFKNLA